MPDQTNRVRGVSLRCLSLFWQSQDAQDLVEYSLLLAFIVLAALALLSAVKVNVVSIWTQTNSSIALAGSSGS